MSPQLHPVLQCQLVILGLGSKSGDPFSPHRLGQAWVDHLATTTNIGRFRTWFGAFADDPELQASVSVGLIGSVTVALVKPFTTMNSVGACVTELLLRGLRVEQLFVAADECDLRPGRFRLSAGSPSRPSGHRGIQAVARALGTEAFGRIRIGVGPVVGSVDAFFTERHPESDRIVATFADIGPALTSLTKLQPIFRPAGSNDALAKWQTFLEVGGTAELAERRSRITDPKLREVGDLPVVVTTELSEIMDRLVVRFGTWIQSIDDRYTKALRDGDYASPIVTLLERGLPADLVPLVRVTRLDLNHIRLDVHIATPPGPAVKVIEVNAAAGGLAAQRLVALLYRDLVTAVGARFASAPLAPFLVDHALRPALRGVQSPRVILVNELGGRAIGTTGNPIVRELLAEHVVDSAIASVDALTWDGTELQFAGQSVHLLYALTNYAVPARAASLVTPAVAAAVCAGAVTLFPSPRNFLYVSKGFLAALSDPASRSVLGVPEGEWQKWGPVFPWCRVWDETAAETVALVRRHGGTVVRKPFFGSGGREVEFLGSTLPGAGEHFRPSRAPSVVQEFVSSPTHPLDPTRHFDLLASIYTTVGGALVPIPLHARLFSGQKAQPVLAPVVVA